MEKVLLYANVRNVNSFNLSKFYLDDVQAISSLGFEVITSNKIFKLLFLNKVNTVLIYFYSNGLFVAILARIFGIKVIFSGGVDDLQKSKNFSIKSIVFTLCYFFSDICNVVSTSDFLRLKRILNFYNFDTKKLILAPHCINVNFSYKNPVKKKYITTICWLGTVANVQRKGVDSLLYFFSKIKHLEYTLHIIGGGTEGLNYLKGITKELAIENKVFFHGGISHDKKNEILSESKYYFQLSDYEGFGLAVLEAMVFNNYIFHSGAGGLNDTIGKNGTILSKDDMGNFIEIFNKVDHFLYNDYDFEKLKKDTLDKFSFQKRKDFFKNYIK